MSWKTCPKWKNPKTAIFGVTLERFEHSLSNILLVTEQKDKKKMYNSSLPQLWHPNNGRMEKQSEGHVSNGMNHKLTEITVRHLKKDGNHLPSYCLGPQKEEYQNCHNAAFDMDILCLVSFPAFFLFLTFVYLWVYRHTYTYEPPSNTRQNISWKKKRMKLKLSKKDVSWTQVNTTYQLPCTIHCDPQTKSQIAWVGGITRIFGRSSY